MVPQFGVMGERGNPVGRTLAIDKITVIHHLQMSAGLTIKPFLSLVSP